MAAHALVFGTIAAAVISWAIGETRRSRAAWTVGAVLTLVHAVAAFGVFYHWSHEIARTTTAQQTLATGIAFEGGIYINYAFVAIWLADAAWWWVSPRGYSARPQIVSAAVRGFIFFIVLNGSVVFADGWARLIGIAAIGSVIGAFAWKSLRPGAASRAAVKQTLTLLLLFWFASSSLTAQSTGTIIGIVTTRAGAPPLARVTIDQKVCGNEIADEAIVRDASGRVANAVLTLAGVKSSRNAPAAGVMNERCRFSPHVQIVRPNATITTTSRDPMLHTTNAQISTGKVLFSVALPLPGIRITRPVAGAGVVRLNCNTHPWMRGWIVVTDEIAAVSGGDGAFTLTGVPAGTFELRVWHEVLQGASQRVTVTPGQTTKVAVVLQ
jgi:hypothetical protein